jgi:ribonuclease HI
MTNIYLNRQDISSALEANGIKGTPHDAGLVWLVISNQESTSIPTEHVYIRYALFEIIIPKTLFSIALDSPLRRAGFTRAHLTSKDDKLVLMMCNPANKPETDALSVLKQVVPGYQFVAMYTLQNDWLSIIFHADLTAATNTSSQTTSVGSQSDSQPSPFKSQNTQQKISPSKMYEMWADASYSPPPSKVIGCGILVRQNQKTILSVGKYSIGTQQQAEFIAAEQALLSVEEGATVRLHVDNKAVVEAIRRITQGDPSGAAVLPSLANTVLKRRVTVVHVSDTNSVELKEAHKRANEARKSAT